MTPKVKKAIKIFIAFLMGIAVFGAFVALANQWPRSQEYNSKYMTTILIGCTCYVYYRAWLWLCKKIDLLEKSSK